MLYYRAEGLRLLYSTLQCFAASLLFWLSLFLSTSITGRPVSSYPRYILYNLVICAASTAYCIRSRQRSPTSLAGSALPDLLRYTFQQSLTILFAILVFLAAAKDQGISRVFLFSYLPLLFIALFLSHRHLPRALSQFVFNGPHQQRTIVLGSLERAHQSLDWLNTRVTYGIQTIGLITFSDAAPSAASPPIPELPVLGNICEVQTILKSRRAVQLILLELPPAEQIIYLREVCEKLGVRLLMLNDLPERVGYPLTFTEDEGVQIIAFRQEPLQSPLNRLLKRGLDVAIALPVVIFVLPITSLLVLILHKLQAPGPLFFRQPRTGFQNNEFQIYKYRTMYIGHGQEALQATANDSRVFPSGRWLRKHSVDELPQFINVLKGEMSVVGPRPHMPEHSRHFNNLASGFGLRAFVKPGITGLAQVEGLRGETREVSDLTKRVRSDLYYLENWSFLLEWTIIFKTAKHIFLPPKAAY